MIGMIRKPRGNRRLRINIGIDVAVVMTLGRGEGVTTSCFVDMNAMQSRREFAFRTAFHGQLDPYAPFIFFVELRLSGYSWSGDRRFRIQRRRVFARVIGRAAAQNQSDGD